MSKLTVISDDQDGHHLLLDDEVVILKGKSRRQVERAREALEFQEAITPALEALDKADSALLAAVLARSGTRAEEESTRRTEAVNALVLLYNKLKNEEPKQWPR